MEKERIDRFLRSTAGVALFASRNTTTTHSSHLKDGEGPRFPCSCGKGKQTARDACYPTQRARLVNTLAAFSVFFFHSLTGTTDEFFSNPGALSHPIIVRSFVPSPQVRGQAPKVAKQDKKKKPKGRAGKRITVSSREGGGGRGYGSVRRRQEERAHGGRKQKK